MCKYISALIKPASSLCNLRCRYCFYNDVSENREIASTGIMKEEVCRKLIERINEYLDGQGDAFISFQGGEPTMAGLDYFRSFTNMTKEYSFAPHYSIQTNGTMINKEWASFFKENSFLVGVSLDGYQTNMDRFRYDPLKRGVFYKVLSGIDELKKEGVDYNILTVVTKDLAKHPEALFDFYKKQKFEWIQLIPCLPPLDEKDNDMALTPELFTSFYTGFFLSWYEDYRNGGVMNVNLFENLAGMLKGNAPSQCGMLGECTKQFVVEANGDAYPCDFYCLDEYFIGNINELSFEQMSSSDRSVDFIESSDCRKKPCDDCKYIKICNGGCKRQNICYLSDDYCGYKEVLDRILPIIYSLINEVN